MDNTKDNVIEAMAKAAEYINKTTYDTEKDTYSEPHIQLEFEGSDFSRDNLKFFERLVEKILDEENVLRDMLKDVQDNTPESDAKLAVVAAITMGITRIKNIRRFVGDLYEEELALEEYVKGW